MKRRVSNKDKMYDFMKIKKQIFLMQIKID